MDRRKGNNDGGDKDERGRKSKSESNYDSNNSKWEKMSKNKK